ncbi:proteasome adapter and scaffold protein ECM29 [Diorhabda sublineata]|uniref:proteasome adapter and scaffold protein ECM29 n=1 Tax=Diorhabda sublineata TaxID=1163346 RepID=UPI0024E0D0FA|nr:proteasome adapter and scaffold protein ECM29 [Diorhabda sublineata]
MAAATDELVLLERVFLRLGSADTDEQLQSVLCKFLPPVLLKLSSPQEGVRKKVMELLIHVNKRIKSRPQVQLPVEVLLTQYQDPSATSFVINFTIIYLKSGFPRLPLDKQAELVPVVLNALENKPQSHVDSLLLLIVPLLGKVKVPTEPEKKLSLFGLNENPQIKKHLLDILLDMILLPYSALAPQSIDSGSQSNVSLPVPPCLSELSYKRLINNNPMKPEELEEIKLGIVKFLGQGVFLKEEILPHLVVAASDTRFAVANQADTELKRFIGSVDWSSPQTSMPLYHLYLGSQGKSGKPEEKKLPANTRIRLKLLTSLGRVTDQGFVFPQCIQIIFDSLYGTHTNTRLKSLALNFTGNIIKYADEDLLGRVAPVLLSGLQKLIREGEEVHYGQTYVTIGMLAQRFPKIVYHDVGLLEMFFSNMESANQELKLQIREGVLNLILAYKYDILPQECNKDDRLNILFLLIKCKMVSEEPMVRFAAVRTLATIFPPDHVPSKYLLLTATGDNKDEVSTEAFKSLYGTTRKTDIDMSQDKLKGKKIKLPCFDEITHYIFNEAESIVKEKKGFPVGNHMLPFNINTYTEILIFLRLCLLRDLDVPRTRDVLKHPCEYSPKIAAHLKEIIKRTSDVINNPLNQYTSLVRDLMLANPAREPLCCMVELVGCLPQLRENVSKNLQWIKDQLSSTKEEVREISSLLYSIILSSSSDSEFDLAVKSLLTQANSKNLETQHGAVLAIGRCEELKLSNNKSNENLVLAKLCIENLIPFLKHQNSLLVSAACTSIGLIGRVSELPLEDGKPLKNGSPDPKRMAIDSVTKIDVLNQLLDVMNNTKFSPKVREKAARSLGLLCVGGKFPYSQEVLQGLLNTAKETKDIEVHFTIGESLVMCCQGVWSPEARNPWITLPEDYVPLINESQADDSLEWLLVELLTLAEESHPNSKQASAIWLLAVIKYCGEREPITKRLKQLQSVFMGFLSESNDIIQDVASKGLCVVYDTYKSEELLTALVKQLTSGSRQVTAVTSDTKLFEEGQLGQSPTGGNLTTYKELCSLASDLNKPDLIYQFMHLANHNAIWNSKKGAAFGFSSIAERCGDDLKAYLPTIIPKMYRYQYDPTPNIQASMHNIWRVLVSDTGKMIDEYYNEILTDLLANINSNQYRVRQSCCLALQDFLKGSPNRSIHDAINKMEELWTKLFRVMDDHHEQTRITANRTAKILSKLCIRGCDISQGKLGVKMVESILPVLLNNGITNTVAEIRLVSLQTVSELVKSAGKQLKPFLPKLIPALLQATGELESSQLSYLSTRLGAQTEAQEALDSARASIAKSHFTTETVSKSLQFADASILEELIPKIIELMKSSVGLGTRIACAHFITLLVVQLGQDIQPYTGKLLAVLVNGLTDRNSAIRKHNATAIGYLVSTAKDSSMEKLFLKLQTWYFEREDDSIRSSCALTIQSIGVHNQDILKSHADIVLPLIFFAMHAEKTPETEKTLEIWNEIWSEQSPGTETGIRQNLQNICDILKTALESPSWTMKAQAANSVSTVATKLGSTMDAKHRNSLIVILLAGLSGRTWNGKDKLLKALSSICSSCKDTIKTDPDINITSLIDAVLKESKKEETVYKITALQSLGEIVSSLEIDRFEEIYSIIQTIITVQNNKEDEDIPSEEISKNREDKIKLKETAYETLGRAWPNNKSTQEKYRELFVEHTVQCLPTNTRSIQVMVVGALYAFVDKLIILSEERLTEAETNSLENIIENILKAVQFALSVGKHVRLRKEALNVVFCLGTKLKEKNRKREFDNLSRMFGNVLPEIANDNSPEIKSRVTDIKKLFN